MNIHPERNHLREPAPDDLWQITVAEIIEENDRLKTRVADLEENARWYVAMVKALLDQLHEYHIDGVWAREHRRGIDPYGCLADERDLAA